MPDSSRPINEITGIKKRSSVLVRGFSALEIAIQAGLVPGGTNEAQFIAYLRGPRGFSDFDLWLTLPGNAGKTATDYFNFLGLAEAIAENGITAQLAADVIQFAADQAAMGAATAAVTAANANLATANATFPSKANLASPTFTGIVDISEQFRLSGDGTEASISGTVNDYAPTGLVSQTILRIPPSAAATLTGLTGGADGRIVVLENTSGSFSLTLSNANSGSTAANRFAFDRDKVIAPGRTLLLIYDSVLSRWVDLERLTRSTSAKIRAGTDDEAFVTAKGLNDSAAWVATTVNASAEITTPAGVRTVTFDGVNGVSRQDTLTASTTYAAPTGLVDGMTYEFIFIQDATGGRVHTMNAFFVPGSVAFAFATGANNYNILTGTYHAGLNKLVGCSVWKSA